MSSRESVRSYTSDNIPNQLLLEVLWAAYGQFNGRGNVPQIGSSYSLTLFSLNITGCYLYIPENNSLVLYDLSVNKETIRPHDGNWPSDAAAVLVIVWNETKMDNAYFASAEAGCLVQNVYLAAVAYDLGTCCVGTISSAGLRSDLKLPSTMTPLLVMPLGYPTSPYPPASPNFNLMTGNLPPVQYAEISLEDTVKNMLFTEAWSTEDLSSQELSQLLWAAYGYTNITYGASYHRTTPSANGIYPLVIFFSNATGVYQYLPESHSTREILLEDKRLEIAQACAAQSWAATAPAIFLVAYNSSYNNGNTGDGGALPHLFMEVNTGAVIQQLFLEASAWNLGANLVSSGLEEWNGTTAQALCNIIGLSLSHIPLYVMPIGHIVEDTVPPVVNTPSQTPDAANVEPYQSVTITATITDAASGVREAILSYTADQGQTWTNTTMLSTANDIYEAEILGFPEDTHVQYKIIAYDHANNSAVDDKDGAYYVYSVIPEFPHPIILFFIIATLITAILAKNRKLHPSHNLGTMSNEFHS